MDLTYLSFLSPTSDYLEPLPETGPFRVEHTSLTDDPPKGEWIMIRLTGSVLIEQGWKIHVSTTQAEAAEVLQIVSTYCLANGLPFKHLASATKLALRLAKYSDRTASGKFITIYPPSDNHFARALQDLDALIGGRPGPYILSDLRYNEGPLYVRFGGFVQISHTIDGKPTLCVRRPDGTLEPDARRPVFRTPEWASTPCVLDASLAARKSAVSQLVYQPRSALHFSNGGGVYLGYAENGDVAVVKEARPWVGMDDRKWDAVRRLENEAWAMSELRNAAGTPELLTLHRGHEHTYLTRRFVDGEALQWEVRRRNPIFGGPDAMEANDYRDWAFATLAAVRLCVEEFHARNVVFGDLHPNNILVGADGTVTFIDFEACFAADQHQAQRMGAVGFTAPPNITGSEVDWYGFGCLAIFMFYPANSLLTWEFGKLDEVLEAIERCFVGCVSALEKDLSTVRFALSQSTAKRRGEQVCQLAFDPLDSENAEYLSRALAAIEELNDAPPSDVGRFLIEGAGTSLAYGWAGILWAAHAVGLPAPSWVVSRVRTQGLAHVGNSGLWVGGAGHVVALLRAGDLDAAVAIAKSLLTDMHVDDDTIWSGRSGVGLALLQLWEATGEPQFLDAAQRMGDQIDHLASGRGLLSGLPGIAIFRNRLGTVCNDDANLRLARQLLDEGIQRNGFTVGERPRSWSTLSGPSWTPLLDFGGGTALASTILSSRSEFAEDYLTACSELSLPIFFDSAGLHSGRCGALMAHAAIQHKVRGDVMPQDTFDEHRQLLRLDEAVFSDGTEGDTNTLGMLGNFGLRVSFDLSTGLLGSMVGLVSARRGVPLLPGLTLA